MRRPIGYESPVLYYCLGCVPDALSESYEPMREGDDHGVPYHCDVCGAELAPSEGGEA